ncbi:TRAP transporter substrate-binding protein [Mesorhizobium sp. 1B3]|uniref:TRAP transporter substrate-binding protein n=1 Tax=Mesorhizobium sp. 1B3 TaxID=3243599 RepID=UPI003D9A06A2
MSRVSMVMLALAASVTIAFSSAHAQTIRLAHHHAVGGTVDKLANKFAELVDEKTDGRVKVRVFPGAQLGQEREAYDLVNQGAVDVSITSPAILETVYPAIAVTSLPFSFRGWDHARELYKGEFGQKLAEGVRANSNSTILGYAHLGFRDLLFVGEAPTTLAEIKGKRMRSPENTVWIRMFELMGTSPTPVTWGEVYSAMQTGIAEGLDSPPATAIDMKFNEVAKSLLKTNHMFGSMVVAINTPKFEALSAEDQALVREAAVEAGDWSDLEVAKVEEAGAYDRLSGLGLKIVGPADAQEWRDAMKPLNDEIAARHPDIPDFIKLMTEEN